MDAQQRYLERKKSGICVACGIRTAHNNRVRCIECLEKGNRNTKEWQEIRIKSDLCIDCGQKPNLPDKRRCQECHKRFSKNAKNHRVNQRKKTIEAYGGACSMCGSTVNEFLQLDHIYNDGARHREKDPRAINLWKWAFDNGFPTSLQLLCASCHQFKDRHMVFDKSWSNATLDEIIVSGFMSMLKHASKYDMDCIGVPFKTLLDVLEANHGV